MNKPMQQTWVILNHLQSMVDQGIQSALSDLKRERANLETAYHAESDLLSDMFSGSDSAADIAYDQSVSDVMSSLQAAQERLVEAAAHVRVTLDTLNLHPAFTHTLSGATTMNARAEARLAEARWATLSPAVQPEVPPEVSPTTDPTNDNKE